VLNASISTGMLGESTKLAWCT